LLGRVFYRALQWHISFLFWGDFFQFFDHEMLQRGIESLEPSCTSEI
jgi:hypothetical protein